MAASSVHPCCPMAASLLEMLIEHQFQVILEMLPDVNDSQETWGSLSLKSLYAFGWIMNFPFTEKLNENLCKKNTDQRCVFAFFPRLCVGEKSSTRRWRTLPVHVVCSWLLTPVADVTNGHPFSALPQLSSHTLSTLTVTLRNLKYRNGLRLGPHGATLSPPNFMTPGKITSLLDVLVSFF